MAWWWCNGGVAVARWWWLDSKGCGFIIKLNFGRKRVYGSKQKWSTNRPSS